MKELKEIRTGLWTFPIPLPNNPLKWLNCYVIKGNNDGRNLLIDTGFNRSECVEALLQGMESLNLEPRKTDVFITHIHADHAGNAALLQKMGCRLLMGEEDFNRELISRQSGLSFRMRTAEGGMPESVYADTEKTNPAIRFHSAPYTCSTVSDGDILSYGDYSLECLEMGGHTPGHICLYDRKNKVMFLGDHVLFDITPNICAWPDIADSLGLYMENLLRLRSFDVELALPAHRQVGGISLNERIDSLLEHHSRRLAEAERIICENNGLCAYEIAGLMTWKIRAKNWDEFPSSQKIFAYGETLAHLDYLEIRGRIRKECDGELIKYYGPKPY